MSEAVPRWPALPLDDWRETKETLHLWMQMVGKLRLALAPMANHWWQVSFYPTARGLTTSAMPYAGGAAEARFDFLDHVLRIETSDGGRRELALAPRSVADFYFEFIEALRGLGIEAHIVPHPVETPEAIPFAEDEVHRSYDPQAARRFWRVLVDIAPVFELWRGRFVGKSSPVHFWWGAFDLACTRFNGRRAPPHPGGVPNTPDYVMREGYSHECISAGWWPGGGGYEDAAFYAYAWPEPAGLRDAPVAPAGAFYDRDLGEFLLPYEAVRSEAQPDEAVLAFLESAYAAAAERAGWDRAALERPASYDPRSAV
ncbi:MAG TPA: DUF5996 family protein [Allosphingosinicella sp.]|jgi:hypothetical protein|nr:DUF5996 family protein [Allosphingosinicella sp.]